MKTEHLLRELPPLAAAIVETDRAIAAAVAGPVVAFSQAGAIRELRQHRAVLGAEAARRYGRRAPVAGGTPVAARAA